jgi:hypothetical protein
MVAISTCEVVPGGLAADQSIGAADWGGGGCHLDDDYVVT